MSWESLPLELYEHIFKNLNFWDRKPLSLVCRRWNQVVFSRSLCRQLCIELSRGDWGPSGDKEQVVLVDEAVVKESERDYRVAYVKWCTDSGPEVLRSISRLLRKLEGKCLLEGLIIDAPLGQMMSDFLHTHGELLTRIRKLQVSTETIDNRLLMERCVLKMGQLETLFWREVSSHDFLQNESPLIVIEAPKLHSAVVKFGDSDSGRGAVWHNSVMELRDSACLKALKVHLHQRMWNRFFEQKLETLEHLTIAHKTQDLRSRDWNAVFCNMPNLKSIQMWEANDAILEAINRHCRKLRVLLLENADIIGFLLEDRHFPLLEHLRLETAKIQSNKTLHLPILKHLEWFNVVNQNNQTLILAAPMLRSIRQSRNGASDFTLSCKPPLEKLQLDLYASDIPGHFFQPFPNMQELSIRVSSARPDLDRMIPYFRSIKEFTLIAYNAPLQCDQMLNEIFKNCNDVKAMTLCGFNPNLELSFPVFAQIFRNRNLKSLKMFGLTITGKSFPLQLPPELETFELRHVKVMDVAFGAYVFSPDEPHRVICIKSENCCSYSSKDCD
ncbi:uncharacterized protein LOC134210617 [Armigeres subalbatus]|uniref:uncharacterized protein LOC134210617 n=1 Tax=Armigeres subalbatus TaxID=124917 RepID=UPI002ED4CD27